MGVRTRVSCSTKKDEPLLSTRSGTGDRRDGDGRRRRRGQAVSAVLTWLAGLVWKEEGPRFVKKQLVVVKERQEGWRGRGLSEVGPDGWIRLPKARGGVREREDARKKRHPGPRAYLDNHHLFSSPHRQLTAAEPSTPPHPHTQQHIHPSSPPATLTTMGGTPDLSRSARVCLR
jgi:hypothetical protein